MKISDCILSCPTTGICEIDVDKIVKVWGKTVLSQYDGEYRIQNRRARVKVTISTKDAIHIISKLGLIEVPHPIFAKASIWRKI